MDLAEAIAYVEALTPEARAQLNKEISQATATQKWTPSPGPQTEAYLHPADIVLFGGQGGGGKTDLLLGLALMEHRRSLILRRKYANLSALTERAIEINLTRDGYNGSSPPLLRTPDGRYIQFCGNQFLGDEQDWQGQPFDFKGFDEACQFLEPQIRFHLGWLRSVTPGQRVRAVLATNPPISAEGDWIVGMFRPWLDLTHDKPAKQGELRWFVIDPDGRDLEVDGPAPLLLPGQKVPSIPMSRTFIRSRLEDNPFLVNTGYQAKLDGLQEPWRSAVRDGNFMIAREDAELQVIPTQWIIAAQDRWKPDGWRLSGMTVMAYDPAGGGKDAAELICRYGNWFGAPISVRGEETADGSRTAATIVRHRRDRAPLVIDVGGGYAGGVTLRLKDNDIPYIPFNGANVGFGRSMDGTLKYANKRAEAWWKFREALDPDRKGGCDIALPPSPELRQDLAAPTYKIGPSGIVIESKDELRKRLGRSTGKADVVIMAYAEGDRAARRAEAERGSSDGRPKVHYAHMGSKRATVMRRPEQRQDRY